LFVLFLVATSRLHVGDEEEDERKKRQHRGDAKHGISLCYWLLLLLWHTTATAASFGH